MQKRVHPLNILITAGPTIEPIDPVRFLSNRSSGKMGYALAEEALRLKHRVVLISGPTAIKPPKGCQFISVLSAREMLKVLKQHFTKCDVLFMAAAVADYRAQSFKAQKIKKTQSKVLMLKLIQNPDLLKNVVQKKSPNQTIVGFAAETTQLFKNAQSKLKNKKLDWIVLNDVSRNDIGFESDSNQVVLFSKDQPPYHIGKQSKKKVAQKILTLVLLPK